jgi:CRISPR-associated protein Cas2
VYVVVAYDISDDARRLRVSRYCEGFGQRVQYSVFECELEDKHLERLVRGLRALAEEGDSIRVYRWASRRTAAVMIIGAGTPVAYPRVTVV